MIDFAKSGEAWSIKFFLTLESPPLVLTWPWTRLARLSTPHRPGSEAAWIIVGIACHLPLEADLSADMHFSKNQLWQAVSIPRHWRSIQSNQLVGDDEEVVDRAGETPPHERRKEQGSTR